MAILLEPPAGRRRGFLFRELRIGATMAPAPGRLIELRGRRHNTPIESTLTEALSRPFSLTFRADLYPLIAGRRRCARRHGNTARAACWPTSRISFSTIADRGDDGTGAGPAHRATGSTAQHPDRIHTDGGPQPSLLSDISG